MEQMKTPLVSRRVKITRSTHKTLQIIGQEPPLTIRSSMLVKTNSLTMIKTILPTKSAQELLKSLALLTGNKHVLLSKMAIRFNLRTFKGLELSQHIIPLKPVIVRAFIILLASSITPQV